VRRQCAAIDPPPRRADLAFGGIGLLGRSLSRSSLLLGILQRQLQLVFGQTLGPTAEAMTLKLPEDLTRPLALEPLGDQHRLEQAGVIGQGVSLRTHRHRGSQTRAARDRFAPTESTRRCRHRRLPRFVHAPPVEPLE
jgi:hypothetical protein